MYYEIGKKIFRFIINSLNFIRVTLVFLSFAIILYWLFQLGGAVIWQPFVNFFEGIRAFTHIFYQRTVTVDQATIDFSFLIATFAILLVVWGLKYVVEYIEKAEERYDSIYKSIKRKLQDWFNINLEQQYLKQEKQINKILVLIKFSAINLSKDAFFNRDADVGVEQKQKEALIAFLKLLDADLSEQKRFLNEGLLLYFEGFDGVEKLLPRLQGKIDELKSKYYEQKWQINSYVGIEVYANNVEIEPKVKNLIMLLELNLKNEALCLGTFRNRYSLINNQKFNIEEKGVYKMFEGEEEVYCIKNL